MLLEPRKQRALTLTGDPDKLHRLARELVDHRVPSSYQFRIVRGVREEHEHGQLSGKVRRAPAVAGQVTQRFGGGDVRSKIARVGTRSHGPVKTHLAKCGRNRECEKGKEGLSVHADAPWGQNTDLKIADQSTDAVAGLNNGLRPRAFK
jgi:hypothetical protein